MRITGILLMLSAAVLFAFGADPAQSQALHEINVANWIMGIGVAVWSVVQGLTAAWFKQRLSSLQTKDGCAENRAKCHVDDLRPLLDRDSERRIKVDLIQNELKHIIESIGEVKRAVESQGDEIAHHAKVLIKIGARFGVDFNGKDD